MSIYAVLAVLDHSASGFPEMDPLSGRQKDARKGELSNSALRRRWVSASRMNLRATR